MRMFAMGCALLATAGTMMVPAAQAEHDSPWMVRVRMLDVIPDESATVDPIGGDVRIDDSIVPELDITYFVDRNWAVELILGVTPHDVGHTPTGLDLGSVWLLPPTLTAQYHFQPDDPVFRPYIGAGINYTVFFGADEPAGLDIHYDNSVGFALQAGFDIPLGGGWNLNVDVKKVFINTDVTIEPLGVRADVDVDPLIVGIGIGYRW